MVTQGVSTTSIEFEIGEDLQKKTDEVRSKIDQARAILPRDIDEPTVHAGRDRRAQPILTYAVAAPDMSTTELSWFVDDTVARALQAAKGVGPGHPRRRRRTARSTSSSIPTGWPRRA